MKRNQFYLNRRTLLAASAGSSVLLLSKLAAASSPTGISVLDTAAVRVKRLAEVVLVAITRTNDRLIAVGEHGVIIYSDDNGTNWAQASVPVTVTLTSVAFATSMLGWAAGHYGIILNTLDGGVTWKEQLNGLQVNALTLIAAQNAEAQKIILPGVPLALKRARLFVQAGPDKPFLTLLVLCPQTVIAFGADRMAVKTTDQGKTWVDWSLHIYDAYSHNIYDATVVGPCIYLAGEEGLVFKSNDFGDNFLKVPSASSTTLFGVIGAGDGSVIVFGVAGSCYRSTDDCKTWSQINIPTQDGLTAGRLLSSGIILLTSEAGMVLLSRDNGATFQIAPIGMETAIFDTEEAANGDLIIVGGSGISKINAKSLTAQS